MSETFNKRQKERAREEKRKGKLEQADIRKREKAERPARTDGDVDPDIAHIIPGPQPIPED
jgi:hypothetical protein